MKGGKESQLPSGYANGACWPEEVALPEMCYSGIANDLLRNSVVSIIC